nr:uncharacterized protein CI109_006049 [Kwoniella shandongensis]KAA5525598.1 hypothetical protein CI109_006049 [Kwoniella shandongensis]
MNSTITHHVLTHTSTSPFPVVPFLFLTIGLITLFIVLTHPERQDIPKLSRPPTVRPDGSIDLSDWVCDEIAKDINYLNLEVERRMEPLREALEKDREELRVDLERVERASRDIDSHHARIRSYQVELYGERRANQELRTLVTWYKSALDQWDCTGTGPQPEEIIFEPRFNPFHSPSTRTRTITRPVSTSSSSRSSSSSSSGSGSHQHRAIKFDVPIPMSLVAESPKDAKVSRS